MSTWMYKVFKEIEAINPENLIEPNMEVQPEDHEAGEIDPDLRKLYGYATSILKEALQTRVEAKFLSGDEAQSKFIEAAEKQEKCKALMSIFWISAKDAFGLWNKESIGVRKGWKIVWSDYDPDNPLLSILKGIANM